MIRKLLFLSFFLLLILPSYAISDFKISPDNPKIGDTITVFGKANPNEEIPCIIWFEITPIENPPHFKYIMNDVNIPTMPNNFKVIAKNVNRLYVSVKMGIWITKSATANKDGVAVISKSNVPTGTYDIKIGGVIKNTSKPVNLKIIASTKIKADENGNFKYSYKVSNLPEGTMVHLDIGGVKKDILIKGNIPLPPPIIEKNSTLHDISNLQKNELNKDYKNSSNNLENHKEVNKDNNTNLINHSNTKIENDSSTIKTVKTKVRETKHSIIAVSEPNKETKIIKMEVKEMEETKNIILGTIIKNINNTAKLIIKNGTEISVKGNIEIKKVDLPNTTLAYCISPQDAKFNPPLILKVNIKPSQNKEIITLYYDNNLKSWVSIPYTTDNDGNINIKINNGGYYAIIEKNVDIETDDQTKLSITEGIEFLKIVISVIVGYIKLFIHNIL